MKHRFQKTAKRWLAMLLCVGMLCQPGLFSAFAQEGPASPAPGTVQSGAPSATPGEAPAAAPAAAAAPRAGTEYPLTNADFSLSGTLTIDGETPDENTVIQDGTKFNIRLEWKLPAGQAYTAEDTFTYTLPEAIPATSRSGDITNSGGEKIGTFSIDGRTVTIQYTQEFLNQSERSSWLNVSGEFQLEDIEAPGGTITIELPGKVWDDADDQDGLRPDSITVHLVADGADTGKVLTLNEENGWSGTFSRLPEYAGGEKIAYTVKEDAVEGYTAAISGDAENGYVVTNTHAPSETSVSVMKVWDDADDQDGLRPDAITVHLVADGEDAGKTLMLNEENGWSGTFSRLPEYAGGEKIAYTVVEDAVDGCTSAISGDAENGYVVTNTHAPSETSVSVMKVWEDAGDQDGLRPDAIVVHLYADGEDTGKTLTLNAENGWKGTFSQLAEYAGGEKIAYTVKEDAVEGYTSAISGDAVKGYVLTNTHTPAPTPTPVQPADPQTPSAGTPQTGDASMPALWLALTALSGTGFASVQIARIRARRRGR